MSNFLKKLFSRREVILLIIIIIIITILGFTTEFFFTMQNFRAMMLIISVNSILAAAMTVLFISGGFDLSAGSVMATVGIVLGILLINDVPIILAIIISLIFGLAIESGIGAIIAKIGVNPFVATLGAMFIFRGIAFVIGEAREDATGVGTPSFTNFPESFSRIAGGSIAGIQYIVFYMVAILIIFYILISKNKFFRQNYYIGGNEDAARLAGIKVDRLKIFNYALVGAMVAVAAILRASRIGTVTASSGETLGLEVVAAVIIGGASLRGGEGSIFGSFLGIVLITIIYNGIIMVGINPYYNNFIVGLILLVSVLINHFIRKAQSGRIAAT